MFSLIVSKIQSSNFVLLPMYLRLDREIGSDKYVSLNTVRYCCPKSIFSLAASRLSIPIVGSSMDVIILSLSLWTSIILLSILYRFDSRFSCSIVGKRFPFSILLSCEESIPVIFCTSRSWKDLSSRMDFSMLPIWYTAFILLKIDNLWQRYNNY